jgi:hypothetical protein
MLNLPKPRAFGRKTAAPYAHSLSFSLISTTRLSSNLGRRFAHYAPIRGVASLVANDPAGALAATWANVGELRRSETRIGVVALRRQVR